MTYLRKTYVEFLSPGLFHSETSRKEVKTRDIKIEVPEDAIFFIFFDILSAVIEVDGEKVQFTSEPVNISPKHYYGGKIYAVDEIKRDFPNEQGLIRKIENEGRNKIIRCQTGDWQPFEETDILIEEAA